MTISSATLIRAAGWVMPPLCRAVLRHRLKRGKEDARRLPERMGIATQPRPAGKLLWCHGASVGESLSALPLIRAFTSRYPGWHVLLTTGTLTSANLIATQLPPRTIHQFIPMDITPWVHRFLQHWRPDAAVWLESELWPTLTTSIARQQIPAMLVNARMSGKSMKRWQHWPRLANACTSAFTAILAQGEQDAAAYQAISQTPVHICGNIKYDAPPLGYDQSALSALESAVAGRPCWLAASTHAGEEALILNAHHLIAQKLPDILTIIVPRHPNRGGEIAELASNIPFAVRSWQQLPSADTQVYIADTMGELGVFYRLCNAALVGGSLVRHGGHNLLEPALLQCAVLHGRHMFNFQDMVAAFRAAIASIEVHNADEIADHVHQLLTDSSICNGYAERAAAVAEQNQGALERTLTEMAAILPR